MMMCAAFAAALFSSCSSEEDLSLNSTPKEGSYTLVIKADVSEATRLGFEANGNALTAQFQEGDRIVAWPRWASGAGNGSAIFLNYTGMEEGKAVFRAQVDAMNTGSKKFHMLLCNGFEFQGTNLQVYNLQDQDGTLASAAKYSVFQADPAISEIKEDTKEVIVSNVKFTAKTAVVKYTFTVPDGEEVPTVGTPITLTTKDVMHHVGIAWGNPNSASLPYDDNTPGKGQAVFYTKVGEVNGNTLTTYLTVWPSALESALNAGEVTMDYKDKIYYGKLAERTSQGAIAAGKLYRAASVKLDTQDLPAYEELDIYNRNGVQGVVVALDADKGGKHGWIMSLDEAELEWLSDASIVVSGNSQTSETAQVLNNCLKVDPTLEKFPAMKWCDDKNRKRTTTSDLASSWWMQAEKRWILPASSTLQNCLGNKYLAQDKSTELAALNAAIEKADAAEKKALTTADWTNYLSKVNYWSSGTKVANGTIFQGRTLEVDASNYIYNGGNGITISLPDDGTLKYKVRAFYHF